MAFTTSPNMNLTIPVVGNEPGPNYAFDVNAALTLVDQHDHSPGKGVKVTPAGLDISSDLSFMNNNAIALSNVIFSGVASSSDLQALYVAPGTESPPIQDLYYNDSNGNVIQITSNGQLNSPAASIPGESYAGGTFFWKQGAGSTVPANFDIGAITLRPNVAATTNGVQLIPPTSSFTTFTFPSYTAALAGNLSSVTTIPTVMQISNAGTITPIASGTNGQYLILTGSGPSWSSVAVPSAPTQQVFTTPNTYVFTVPALSTQTNAGAIYTNNGFFFTVTITGVVGATSLTCTGTGTPLSSGALTRYSGSTGQTSISFTSVVYNNGTYTTPAGARTIKIRMIGAGGGGGASQSGAGANNGGTGGDTTFDSYLAAGGGGGQVGTGSSGSGLGGTPNANSAFTAVSIEGGRGGSAIYSTNTQATSSGGNGGSGAFGGAGNAGVQTASSGSVSGQAAAPNSGGGGGGSGSNASSAFGGGGGASGGYVEQVISSPASTYNFSVGASGPGGSATTGTLGGAGGSGIIIVDEYY